MGGRRKQGFLTMVNGVGFQLNDLVNAFVGPGKRVTGNTAFPIKGRFKGRRVAILRRHFFGGRCWSLLRVCLEGFDLVTFCLIVFFPCLICLSFFVLAKESGCKTMRSMAYCKRI